MGCVDVLLDTAAERHSIHGGHHHVGYHQVDILLGNYGERLLAIGCLMDVVLLCQFAAQELTELVVVVNNEQIGLMGFGL